MTDDIVARLREEGFITHMARLPRESKILHEAADEIERLRAERNQLRAEIVDRALGFMADVPWNSDSKERKKCEKYAAQRGWFDLFEDINKRAAELEAERAPAP